MSEIAGDVLLVGGGGHCRSVIEAMRGSGFRPVGIVDKDPSLDSILGVPVVGDDSQLPSLRSRHDLALVTVGQIKNHAIRWLLYQRLKESGYMLPVMVSPLASVSPWARAGEGTVVLHFAMVNANAAVGENCIINSGAIIEHDAVIGRNCHVSTRAVVNGCTQIGNNCFIGSGAVIREGISIGCGSVIGMGASVKKDVPAGSVVRGSSDWRSLT